LEYVLLIIAMVIISTIVSYIYYRFLVWDSAKNYAKWKIKLDKIDQCPAPQPSGNSEVDGVLFEQN